MNMFQHILSKVDLKEVVESGEMAIHLTKFKDKQFYIGVCPLCFEEYNPAEDPIKHATFVVFPDTQTYMCRNCQQLRAGDAIEFLCKRDDISPIEAANLLINKYSIAITQEMIDADNDKILSGDKVLKVFDPEHPDYSWRFALDNDGKNIKLIGECKEEDAL